MNAIKAFREKHLLTLADVARMADRAVQTVFDWERKDPLPLNAKKFLREHANYDQPKAAPGRAKAPHWYDAEGRRGRLLDGTVLDGATRDALYHGLGRWFAVQIRREDDPGLWKSPSTPEEHASATDYVLVKSFLVGGKYKIVHPCSPLLLVPVDADPQAFPAAYAAWKRKHDEK